MLNENPTIAVTGLRRTGKTTTLSLLGWFYRKAGYEIWADYNLKIADRRFAKLTDIKFATSKTIMLSDEAYRLADARQSMSNIADTYAIILQGHYPNVSIAMSIPFSLNTIAMIDVRIRYMFDLEIKPTIDKERDLLILELYYLREGQYLNHTPLIRQVNNISQIWQLFDTHEKFNIGASKRKVLMSSSLEPYLG